MSDAHDGLDDAAYSASITVYLVRYRLNGQVVYVGQSLDRDTAIGIGRMFRKEGKRPVIVRIRTTPDRLLKCGERQYKSMGWS